MSGLVEAHRYCCSVSSNYSKEFPRLFRDRRLLAFDARFFRLVFRAFENPTWWTAASSNKAEVHLMERLISAYGHEQSLTQILG
jgi:hypothetical protein